MTERLDRIEAILERNAEQIAQSQQRHGLTATGTGRSD